MKWVVVDTKIGEVGVWREDDDDTPLTIQMNGYTIYPEVPDGPIPDDNR